nr:unnamed protein product [Leishmania braziliensis]
MKLHVNWSNWGASLPPKGYTMSQRNISEAPADYGGQQSSEQASRQRGGGDAVAGRGQLSAAAPLPGSAHRWKRRRTEHVLFISLLKEVFMYLDTITSTQQQQPDHRRVAGHAEEDEEDKIQGATALPLHAAASRYSTACPAIPHGLWARNRDRSGPLGAASAPLMSVDSAVRDTLRVLQQCWEYCGAPHDAFEPIRLLSPITVHLLLTYGHHTVTHDGQYVVLRGGAEHLPWVGCLYSILLVYAYRHRVAPTIALATGTDEGDGSVALGSECISRLLLLNCHSFGWLNHNGAGEYECSHRRLYQVREALLELLEDPRYTALGRPAGCHLCASSMVGGDAWTLVLLGDTIVMEGGVPSLGLAHPRDTFTAHYQYGRGIACCVPDRGGDLQLDSTGTPVVAGRVAHTPTAGKGLCAVHRESPQPEAMQASREWHPDPHQQHRHLATPSGGCQVEESFSTLVCSGGHDGPLPGVISSSWLTSTGAAPCRLPAVCCGVCRALGVLGQAVLLGPTGSLVIHLQFDEREWFDMGAPIVPAATAHGWLPTATADTTAACPPLSSHWASQYAADPATALAAVLYAVLQGGSATSFAGQHCHASVGGHRSSSTHVGGSVSLAEFVEWLVWLLNAPQPALVVEWHVSTSTSTTTTTCTTHRCEDVTPSLSRNLGVCGGSQVSVSSPCTPAAQLHSPLVSSRSPVTAPPHSMHSCGATFGSKSSFPVTRAYGRDEGYATASLSTDHPQYEDYLTSSSAPHGTTTSVPLGTLTQPRRPTVMQLLETYSDVVQSRAAVPAPPATTLPTSSVGSSCALPFTHANGTSEHAAEAMKPHRLLDCLLAAQESLRLCEATSLFDGVERPLVLAKELEVAAEAERLLNASSVVTSLQFRPRSARL